MNMNDSSFRENDTEQKQEKQWRQQQRRRYEEAERPERWIKARMKGMDERNRFTSTLARHGVRNHGYPRCTDATYRGALGRGAKALRAERGLRRKDTIRDYMTTGELETVEYAEDLARRDIDANGVYGNDDCAAACEQAGEFAREVKELAGDMYVNRRREGADARDVLTDLADSLNK
jgi:hypothetical protein